MLLPPPPPCLISEDIHSRPHQFFITFARTAWIIKITLSSYQTMNYKKLTNINPRSHFIKFLYKSHYQRFYNYIILAKIFGLPEMSLQISWEPTRRRMTPNPYSNGTPIVLRPPTWLPPCLWHGHSPTGLCKSSGLQAESTHCPAHSLPI